MNCIPGSGAQLRVRKQTGSDALKFSVPALFVTCGLLLAASCSATDEPEEPESSVYSLNYQVTPLPDQNRFQIELTLEQPRSMLIEMSMTAPVDYFSDFEGDGRIGNAEGRLTWNPPAAGGVLRWITKANRAKTKNRYDAYMSDTWAVLRASDIIPPATTRTAGKVRSKTSLKFELPAGWSSVTQYEGRNHVYAIENPTRRFDRPTGWILLGKIGTRTEELAGIKVKIAGPRNQSVRRMDMLALLAWTLPEASRLFADFPDRLTVISANDPFWRGGLSAPSSLFLHATLPLVSENGTSTLLHEIVHIGMRTSAREGADWVVEGMAEYFALQLLLRSGTISASRYAYALDSLRDWGKKATTLCSDSSSGAVTAKAAVLMHELDQEISTSSDQQYNLDDVMSVLASLEQKITITDLKHAVARYLPDGSGVLDAADLDNCPN